MRTNTITSMCTNTLLSHARTHYYHMHEHINSTCTNTLLSHARTQVLAHARVALAHLYNCNWGWNTFMFAVIVMSVILEYFKRSDERQSEFLNLFYNVCVWTVLKNCTGLLSIVYKNKTPIWENPQRILADDINELFRAEYFASIRHKCCLSPETSHTTAFSVVSRQSNSLWAIRW